MNLRLIVFDWDGTLMDSETRIVAAMQQALTDLGQCVQESGLLREVIGLGLIEAVRVLLPNADADTQAAVRERYRGYYLGQAGIASPLFPGAADVVTELAQRGYLLAVATGKSRIGLDKSLHESGLRRWFHYTRCADEAPSKPHPQMLLDIMHVLDVIPAHTLMIGDTEYDMQLAANAGTRALAVSYGVHPPERLFSQGALACVQDVREIPAWLAQHTCVNNYI